MTPPTRSALSPSFSPWIRKPLSVVHQQEAYESEQNSRQTLRRHLNVWDLICIGVCSSVGSGIFVLTGEIASQTTGPLTCLSFAISGIAACLSGVCYAELSGRIPAAGSTYVYAYICLGEVAAVLASACLSLEYGIAGAAVARSWGDKLILWTNGFFPTGWMEIGTINLPACFVSVSSTLVLLAGVHESKQVTNAFTALKLFLVAFMTIGGYALFQKKNMIPLTPFGFRGVFRGATSSFFAYLGYDEVCCVAGEAINPARTMPLAVLSTLLIVTLCYVFSALALTGMVHYTNINPTSGFPDAFLTRGIFWAAHVTSLGELVCLPVVVLVSLMAQPRLALSMAQDGLLPQLFSKLDANGNLVGGTVACGVAMTFIATFMPFAYLSDLISAGILVAFSMTDSCLVLLRCESPLAWPGLVEQCLIIYNISCFLTAFLWNHNVFFDELRYLFTIMTAFSAISSFGYLVSQCPQSAHFGGSILLPSCSQASLDPHEHEAAQYFRTPFVPFLPCFGMAINWYLVAQLEITGILYLIVYLGATVLIYFCSCAHHSHGHNHNWSRRHYYDTIAESENLEAEDAVLSMPHCEVGNDGFGSKSIS